MSPTQRQVKILIRKKTKQVKTNRGTIALYCRHFYDIYFTLALMESIKYHFWVFFCVCWLKKSVDEIGTPISSWTSLYWKNLKRILYNGRRQSFWKLIGKGELTCHNTTFNWSTNKVFTFFLMNTESDFEKSSKTFNKMSVIE